MTLILTHMPPLHWAIAGAAIAVITLALLFVANTRLGISSGLEDLCSLALPGQRYFSRGSLLTARKWRLPFVAGLMLGGCLSAVLHGGWAPTWNLGMLDQAAAFSPVGKLAWMFVGGLFIGFGTRLANGCTSGHGIFGMSNLEGASLASTVTFMAVGIATTQCLYRLVFHGAGL
jgi:uncharacterized membrane protein YedE/YeeE